MTVSPLNDRVRKQVTEIVVRSRGDRHQANRLMRVQLERDAQFLRDLVEPFLDGIVAHALSIAMPHPVRTAAATSLSSSALDDIVNGMRLGMERGGPVQSPAQSDPSAHADTIRALAAAQARRRKQDN